MLIPLFIAKLFNIARNSAVAFISMVSSFFKMASRCVTNFFCARKVHNSSKWRSNLIYCYCCFLTKDKSDAWCLPSELVRLFLELFFLDSAGELFFLLLELGLDFFSAFGVLCLHGVLTLGSATGVLDADAGLTSGVFSQEFFAAVLLLSISCSFSLLCLLLNTSLNGDDFSSTTERPSSIAP